MSGQITAIEPQARHANRYNLYIDNRFTVGLSAIVAAKLRVGQTLGEAELAELEKQEGLEDAHEKALRFLEPRPRSTAEVKQHLRKKKVAPELIEPVLARLTDAGLLDDAAFAKFWVENREQFRPRAGRALRFELRRKGLNDTAIAEALETVDESESAYRAGLARAQRWSALERREFRDKICAFLVRRGFSYEVAKQAAERLWAEVRS
ncbi:MAG: RecX family transcriptional regulator [Chloroflexi bacterium]|nr:RecX family transcriptional regulator [Chloroflexota bacterium]